MEKKMNNKGFSLVELIVVIAIMAVLVGVLAPQFIKYVEKSRQSTDIQNVDSVRTVIEAYYSDKDGTDLPESVKITITDSKIECKTGTKGSESKDESLALTDAGVQNNRLKSKKWGTNGVIMQYTPVDGSWKYTGETDIYTSKDSSGNDTDKFVLKKPSKSE